MGYLLPSLLSVAAGVVALVWPNITALELTLWVAAWAFVTAAGAVEVRLAFRHGETPGERAMWGFGGLISIALGVVLAIRRDIGTVSLATVFRLFSIVIGTYQLVLAAQTRRLDTTSHHLVESTP